jgi:hypothetical protein
VAELDPALAVEAVEALHHVVRLAGALHRALAGGEAAPSRRATSADMVQNQASSAEAKGSARARLERTGARLWGLDMGTAILALSFLNKTGTINLYDLRPVAARCIVLLPSDPKPRM